MSKRLTALLITVVYVVLFACQALLAASVLYYRNTDCNRTAALVAGVHAIVDTNAHRQAELFKQGKISRAQFASALAVQRRAHLTITRPDC